MGTSVRPLKKTPITYILIWNIIFFPIATLILFKILIVLYNAAHGLGFVALTSVFTTGPRSIELTKSNHFGDQVPKTNQNNSRCHFTMPKHQEHLVMGLPQIWRIKGDLCELSETAARACVAQHLCFLVSLSGG